MSNWIYRDGDQEVGPFAQSVLEQLAAVGVIHEKTEVREQDGEWCKFGELLRTSADSESPSSPPTRWFYLSAERKPVGPLEPEILRQFRDNGIIDGTTLVASEGSHHWVPAVEVFGSAVGGRGEEPRLTMENEVPTHRSFERYALMMGVTLTFYLFYLIPLNSRDMKTITGRPRMEFTPLLFLGILSLGVLLLVMLSLWAFDLERHGNERVTPGRQESLGAYVLALNILSLVLAFFSGGLALVLSAAVTVAAVWLLGKEINLYAKAPSHEY